MYYIYDFYHDHTYYFEDLNDLLKFIIINDIRDSIAHNYNDVIKYHYDTKTITYVRNLILYDEYDRIINYTDVVKKVLIDYKPTKKEQYYRFRQDPVPGTGKEHYTSWFRNSIKRNKSYAVSLLEHQELFPNDGRAKQRLELVRTWNDDLGRRSSDKSWKRTRKCRKQWQKNIGP